MIGSLEILESSTENVKIGSKFDSFTIRIRRGQLIILLIFLESFQKTPINRSIFGPFPSFYKIIEDTQHSFFDMALENKFLGFI